MSFAVLTGDIVASEDAGLAATQAALDALRRAAEDFGKDREEDLRFTRFRGDGWQAMTSHNSFFDATLFLLARLRAEDEEIETRISIGIGEVESSGTRDLSDASGSAFTQSGRGLDAMGRRDRLAISGAGIGPFQRAALALTDYVTSSWTAAQGEAVALSLDPATQTQDDIARRIGVTRQAVQLRLSAAGLPWLAPAREAFASHDYRET
ncbi:hypothetical protein [Histidinibacterium aquaticum]|uniref:Uncharacterized protein n=1 Tax=Histidinibacterium aquaticum TaxID=2613962 RepID=A0A5J5GKU3_9RHOB|nr:hypothetical protein [Histidinibacterium aquaticum]KAA9008946.1 hypothetical protein F3S47_06700 [Histidinibacterium aquaticum]